MLVEAAAPDGTLCLQDEGARKDGRLAEAAAPDGTLFLEQEGARKDGRLVEAVAAAGPQVRLHEGARQGKTRNLSNLWFGYAGSAKLVIRE